MILSAKIPSAMADVGMVQFTTTMAYDNLKYTDIYNSGAVTVLSFEEQNTRGLKKFLCKLLWFLLCRYCIVLNLTPLRSPDIFYDHASRSQKEKILRWNKHVGQQADPVSVHCLQTNEKPREKYAFILVVVRPTVVQSSFHTEFLSSIRFSPLQLRWRRQWTINFLAFSSGHEEELKLSLPTTKAN